MSTEEEKILASPFAIYKSGIKFDPVWNAKNPDGSNVSVWKPQPPPGYSNVGNIAIKTSGNEEPIGVQVLFIEENEKYQKNPLDFVMMYSTNSFSVWRPIPPPHYIPLSDVLVRGQDKPNLSIISCVNENLLRSYNDYNTELYSNGKDLSLWKTNEYNSFQANLSTFPPILPKYTIISFDTIKKCCVADTSINKKKCGKYWNETDKNLVCKKICEDKYYQCKTEPVVENFDFSEGSYFTFDKLVMFVLFILFVWFVLLKNKRTTYCF
jgi:hypothetical protein